MSQQLDEAGGALLTRMIGDLGIEVHLDVGTDSIEAARDDDAVRVTLGDGTADRRRRGDVRGRRAPTRRAGPVGRTRDWPSAAVC